MGGWVGRARVLGGTRQSGERCSLFFNETGLAAETVKENEQGCNIKESRREKMFTPSQNS